ncbi:MAG: DUF2969 domain-containing protein [Lactobacillus sp.]|nr:DUF2969 domain-containing protein [Lactobacillus sp.]
MSKKPANIQIEVNELKGKKQPTWEVVIPGKASIGIIEEIEGRFRATSTKSTTQLFDKTLEASLNSLLAHYALHEK